MSTTTTVQQPQAHLSTSHTSASNPSDSIPRGPTRASLTFYAPPADGSAPWNYVEAPPEGSPQRNYTEHPHPVLVSDIRGREHEFKVNYHGFGVVSGIDSKEKEFISDDSIKANYYPEVEETILKHISGAKRVLLFDHTVRRSSPNAPRAPVNRVHIDQTAKSAKQRVEYHLPDEAEDLLKGRVRIINVWRPLNGPVVSSPLGFAASDSVPDSAVVPVEHRYPHRTGETAGIEYSGGQRWYYWSGMTNDERLFLQCYDSKDGARVAHTAFQDPHTPAGGVGRDSIEVRALVFG
ncbi:hypothetical protein MBLNU457_4274t1 [Dothideomycetes sp. NU457]